MCSTECRRKQKKTRSGFDGSGQFRKNERNGNIKILHFLLFNDSDFQAFGYVKLYLRGYIVAFKV